MFQLLRGHIPPQTLPCVPKQPFGTVMPPTESSQKNVKKIYLCPWLGLEAPVTAKGFDR